MEFLKMYYEMACHNLMCYSKTLAMDTPKAGLEKQWEECSREILWLEQMMRNEIQAQLYNATVLIDDCKRNLDFINTALSSRAETLLYNAIVLLEQSEEFKNIEHLKSELGISDEEYAQVME